MVRADRPDSVIREWGVTVEGTNHQVMIALARTRAARFFGVPIDDIQIDAGTPHVTAWNPFHTDMDTPAEPSEWSVHVLARVKDEEPDDGTDEDDE